LRGKQYYYYRQRRHRGRVLTTYVGAAGSPEAERAAALDKERRARRLAGWEELRQARARWREAETPLLQLVALSDRLGTAALCLGGFYRHQRGEWKRRREHKQEEHQPGAC
jgi:hypothetical protein